MTDQKTIIQDPRDWRRFQRLSFRLLRRSDRRFIATASFFAGVAIAGSAAVWIFGDRPLARNNWEREHLARIAFSQTTAFAFDGRFKPDDEEMGLAVQATFNHAVKVRRNMKAALTDPQKPCYQKTLDECADLFVKVNLEELGELAALEDKGTARVELTKSQLQALKAINAVAADLARYKGIENWNSEVDVSNSLRAFEILSQTRSQRLEADTSDSPNSSKDSPQRQKRLPAVRSKVAEAPEE